MKSGAAQEKIATTTITISPGTSIRRLLEEAKGNGIRIDGSVARLFQNQETRSQSTQSTQSQWKISWREIANETPVATVLNQYCNEKEEIDDSLLHILILTYAQNCLPENQRERLLFLFVDSQNELIAINVNKKTIAPFHGNLVNSSMRIAIITRQ
ncbi:MAG: hypothetical protein RIQ54_98 [Candidatus Parcubacteria bacterium]|jgi:hypothetical protein